LASLLLEGRIGVRSVGIAFGSAVIFTGMLVRLGRTTPVEQLRTLNGPEAEKPSKDTVSGEAGTAAASAVPHTVAPPAGTWKVAAIVLAALLLIPAVLLGVWFLTGRSEESGPTSAATSSFGPEITQVLGSVEGDTTHWLDLDTGRQMPLSFPDDEAAKLALFRTNGLDLMGIVTKEEIGVACREMVVRKVEGSRWDRASAQEIVSETASTPVGSGADAVAVITTSPRRKVTMFFRTREGGHGILQIIGQSQNPLGVKIRYKLVREAGETAQTTGVGPRSRTFILRHRLASEMAEDLRPILQGQPGQKATPAPDNVQLTVTAPPDVSNRGASTSAQ